MQQVMALLGQDEEGRPVRVEVLDEAPLDENFQVHLIFVVFIFDPSLKKTLLFLLSYKFTF